MCVSVCADVNIKKKGIRKHVLFILFFVAMDIKMCNLILNMMRNDDYMRDVKWNLMFILNGL